MHQVLEVRFPAWWLTLLIGEYPCVLLWQMHYSAFLCVKSDLYCLPDSVRKSFFLRIMKSLTEISTPKQAYVLAWITIATSFVCKWSQSAALSLTIWLFWHGAPPLSLDMEQGFFFPEDLHHSTPFPPLHEEQQTQERRAKVCHFSLASQGLFGGKKKFNPCVCSKGSDIYLSLPTNLSFFASSFKMLELLRNNTGKLPASGCFLRTWRVPQNSSGCFRQPAFSCWK